MDIDLFKYILRLSVIPMLFLSLLLITHGTDDSINVVNMIGIVLLIISGTIIINNASKDEESK
nr:MAG: hypothetical protein [Bacteriophage sp.]